MSIRASRHDPKAPLLEAARQGLSVRQDVLLVFFEARGERLFQGDSLGSDDMHQRPPLETREDRLVQRLGILSLAHHHTASRPAQRLVGRGGDKVGIGDGTRMRSEEHTSELQSLAYLVCRLLLEKKKKNIK